MLNAMSILNFTVALVVLLYGLHLALHGRKINRWMFIVSALAGLWASVMYAMFIVDQVFVDFVSGTFIREYCIKPVIFILLCTILAWLIRSGWRDDH
jgi:hypothetical protein